MYIVYSSKYIYYYWLSDVLLLLYFHSVEIKSAQLQIVFILKSASSHVGIRYRLPPAAAIAAGARRVGRGERDGADANAGRGAAINRTMMLN